jgi:hypothetical protein
MPQLKPEVNDVEVSREIWFALGVAAAWHKQHGFPMIVTSLNDGHHNPESKHPNGEAADLRTKHLPESQQSDLYVFLRSVLDAEGFDVVEEGAHSTQATTAAHCHIEFDPKPGEEFIRRAV